MSPCTQACTAQHRRSYWQFYLGFDGLNVSLSMSGGKRPLNILAEPITCAHSNCSDYALVILPRYVWYRSGSMDVSTNGSIALSARGMEESMRSTITATVTSEASLTLPPSIKSRPHLAFTFGGGAVGLREGVASRPSREEVTGVISAARETELTRYQASATRLHVGAYVT